MNSRLNFQYFCEFRKKFNSLKSDIDTKSLASKVEK